MHLLTEQNYIHVDEGAKGSGKLKFVYKCNRQFFVHPQTDTHTHTNFTSFVHKTYAHYYSRKIMNLLQWPCAVGTDCDPQPTDCLKFRTFPIAFRG